MWSVIYLFKSGNCFLNKARQFMYIHIHKKKNVFTLILEHASCVDSIPRRSLIIKDPRYYKDRNFVLNQAQSFKNNDFDWQYKYRQPTFPWFKIIKKETDWLRVYKFMQVFINCIAKLKRMLNAHETEWTYQMGSTNKCRILCGLAKQLVLHM